MSKEKQTTTSKLQRIQHTVNRLKPEVRESPLLLMRLKELDREFHNQTKQLTQLTRDIKNKLRDKL